MATHVPMGVLSERLEEAIDGRRVRCALFTTFAFEPDFFEEEVLPCLFDQAFSHEVRIRRVAVSHALRDMPHAAVYYDPSGLVAAGGPARLDVRRIAIRRSTGFFHPKLTALLVENRDADDGDVEPWLSLVVQVSSANLTRAGWWENVEVAQIAEIEADCSSSLRDDLLGFLARLKREDRSGADHAALDAIRDFLRRSTRARRQATRDGVLHPRIWYGQQPLAEFLRDTLRPPFDDYHLEVISPYLDGDDAAPALTELVDKLRPKDVRVFLPRKADGTASCGEAYNATVEGLASTSWASLPKSIVQRSTSGSDKETERFVHAKVYRLWSRKEGKDYLLIGSPNLTRAGHARTNAGNLEAAMLVDLGTDLRPRAWLRTLDDDEKPTSFDEAVPGEGEEQAAVPPLLIRHLWEQQRTEYYWDGRANPGRVVITNGGITLATLESVKPASWCDLSGPESQAFADLLVSTSYVDVEVGDALPATLLVSEEEMAHAPDLLLSLSAAEILKYWSLLSPEQRESFLDQVMPEDVLGALVARSPRLARTESLFDTFAGIFHAFSQMESHVRTSLEEGNAREAEYRLFGQKYDSLPTLLEKVLSDTESDVVNRYVTVLTARQLVDRLVDEERSFMEDHPGALAKLREQLDRGDELREELSFGEEAERRRFLEWFDDAFLHGRVSP